MPKPHPKQNQDLRFAPADESMSEKELRARADGLAGAAISGGAPRKPKLDEKPLEPTTGRR
ncbi:MAG: hypothetical protein OXF79_22270 [Chloroflexi bacterium]|nr:hypothetical protein [Chloroflexota bacterium]